MNKPHTSGNDLRAFDLTAFSRAKRETRGTVRLGDLARIAADVPPDAPAGARDTLLHWVARGDVRREIQRDTQKDAQRQAQADGQRDASRPESPLTATSHTVNQPYLTLAINGQVWLECQRCMRAFALPLDIETTYRVMASEAQADAVALDDADIEVIVGSEAFDLIDLIDEEALLSLPMVPKHDVCPDVHESVISGADGSLGVDSLADVEARAAATQVADPAEPGDPVPPSVPLPGERTRPFAALDALRRALASDDDGAPSMENNGKKKQ